MANLWERLRLIGSKKRCREDCFHYDEDRVGCSYTSYDFNANERVKPGRKCLHPEWDESQVIVVSLMDVCNALASGYVELD